MTKAKKTKEFNAHLVKVLRDNSTKILCLSNIATLLKIDRDELITFLLIGRPDLPGFAKLQPLRDIIKTIITGNASRLRQSGKMIEKLSDTILLNDFDEGQPIAERQEQSGILIGSPYLNGLELDKLKYYYDTKPS